MFTFQYYNNLLDHFAKSNRSPELTATYTDDLANVVERLKVTALMERWSIVKKNTGYVLLILLPVHQV